MKTGIELIAIKRLGHSPKGYDINHDLEHKKGALAKVAAVLAVVHTDASVVDPDGWESNSNPLGLENNEDVIDRLAIAGSLIAAEIDRIQEGKK